LQSLKLKRRRILKGKKGGRKRVTLQMNHLRKPPRRKTSGEGSKKPICRVHHINKRKAKMKKGVGTGRGSLLLDSSGGIRMKWERKLGTEKKKSKRKKVRPV